MTMEPYHRKVDQCFTLFSSFAFSAQSTVTEIRASSSLQGLLTAAVQASSYGLQHVVLYKSARRQTDTVLSTAQTESEVRRLSRQR